jgi:hypothetical protein
MLAGRGTSLRSHSEINPLPAARPRRSSNAKPPRRRHAAPRRLSVNARLLRSRHAVLPRRRHVVRPRPRKKRLAADAQLEREAAAEDIGPMAEPEPEPALVGEPRANSELPIYRWFDGE